MLSFLTISAISSGPLDSLQQNIIETSQLRNAAYSLLKSVTQLAAK